MQSKEQSLTADVHAIFQVHLDMTHHLFTDYII